MYCLNFFDISAIDDGFCMVFRDAWIVSPSMYNSSNSPLCYSSKRRPSASWRSFNLEFLEGFCNTKFGISITALNEIPFNGEPWIHSFNSLVVSSIYLFPQEPEGKRKRFLLQKTTLSYIMSMVLDEMVLPVCGQGYSIVRKLLYRYHYHPQDKDVNWTSYVRSIYVLCPGGSRWYIVFVVNWWFVSFFTFSFMSI